MKIFFDHQAFSFQNYGGISRYFCELISGINKTSNSAHLSLLWSNNAHLHEYNFSTLSYPFPRRYRLLQKSNHLYNYIDSKIGQYDVYHATYFDDFLGQSIGSKPFVTTFYDMIYERLSHEFVELSSNPLIINQKKQIAERASHLIAISDNTKQDMVDILGIAPEKITVIYLGSPFLQSQVNSLSKVAKIADPYLLYVGNRSGYKNFIPFVCAISNILIKYQIKLICAGGGNFSADEKSIIQSLFLTKLIEQKPINDGVLKDLYTGATAFILPSLYEGFGIPILEAFSCNCPCVVSNNSSLPEVAGNAALYIDPQNNESIASAVENIIIDSSLQEALVKRGQEQLSLFSYQRTVNETVNLYKKLV